MMCPLVGQVNPYLCLIPLPGGGGGANAQVMIWESQNCEFPLGITLEPACMVHGYKVLWYIRSVFG